MVYEKFGGRELCSKFKSRDISCWKIDLISYYISHSLI